jgi:hypothetical protein
MGLGDPWISLCNLLTHRPPSIRRFRSIPGFSPQKIPSLHHQDSRFCDSQFPEMGNLMTRGLRHSDGLDLFQYSTMESLDLLSSGLPISRFPISQSGKSHDTWSSLLRLSRSIWGISPLFTGVLTLEYLLTDPTVVGFSSRDLIAQTVPN